MRSVSVAVDDLRPPFTHELAAAKVQALEDLFNTRRTSGSASATTA
jgi:nuclear transport factor 2 (NTF2) superfamily protein